MTRYASIDIGTNSAVLLIAENRDGILAPVHQRMAQPRVGRGVKATGKISPDAFAALVAALKSFLSDIQDQGATLTGAVATEAFRRASNGSALLEELSALLGVPCRMLTGEEEARLGLLAVSNRHPLQGLAVLDIGAGSTEVTWEGGAVSLPIGGVSLSESHRSQAAEYRAAAKAALAESLAGARVPAHCVAVGGTASALAMLHLKLEAFDSKAIEGLALTLQHVTKTIDRLDGMSEQQRARIPGLGKGRADIVVPGLCILEAFLAAAGKEHFLVSDRGIRYGVILDALRTAA